MKTRFLFVGILCLLNLASIAFANTEDADSTEYSYGPPPVPSITVSEDEYKSRLKTLDQNKDNSDFLYELAYLAFQMKEYDKAEEYFKLSAEVNNYAVLFYSNADFLNYWYGCIYEERGSYDKALEFYKKADNSYYVHLIKAKIHRSNKDFERAEDEYKKALRVMLFEICNYESYVPLIEMSIEIEDYEKAEKYTIEYTQFLFSIENDDSCGMWGDDISAEIEKANTLLKKIQERRKK